MLSVKQGSIKHHLLNLWYDLSFDWIPVSQTVEYYEYLNPCDSTHTNYCYKMGLVTWSHTIDCNNKLDFYSELPHKVWHAVKPANRLTNQTVCIYVCTIYAHARVCVCVCVCVWIQDWKVHMMTSYLLLVTFCPMRSKPCNTNGWSVRKAREGYVEK